MIARLEFEKFLFQHVSANSGSCSCIRLCNGYSKTFVSDQCACSEQMLYKRGLSLIPILRWFLSVSFGETYGKN
jgi:hypothetical protein